MGDYYPESLKNKYKPKSKPLTPPSFLKGGREH